MTIHHRGRRTRAVPIVSLIAVLACAIFVTAGATAGSAATPQSNSAPSVSGRPIQGHTLRANNGNWANSPTSFAYQWQQCDSTGAGCSAISGATSRTYTAASGDVDKTLRVAVTASNSDGSASAASQPTQVVSSNRAPVNTANPTISGTPKAGEQLTANPGTWTGGVSSFSYQWQRCDANGGSCSAVADATAKAYGVRSVDSGNTLRVVVTATNLSGSTNASSGQTSVVGGITPITVRHNHAPTIAFVSLRRLGNRLYARFRVCDDSSKNVTVIEHDVLAGRLGYTRRFSVAPVPCGTHARSWMLIPRFRLGGRFTASLRAVDKSGASSRTVFRTLRFRAV
ncbi:MAG TPA: hypothetical protein VH063_14340 [Gaiellaceae bacterium]|nr:hypothetical protein [Gaiellaceae bacterium]